MIRAYPGRPSVQAGDTLHLHVSGDAPRFRIAVYRWEDGLVPVWRSAWLRAEHLPDGRPDEDWQWPPCPVETGDDRPSGVYLAHLELPEGGELRLSADSLSGASYRHGGGWWDGPRETPGFIVQQSGHWIFAGTGLARGDALGADTWPPLPGYECDGVPVDHLGQDGIATLSAWRDEAGTPDGYQLLAACPLDRRWQAGEGIHVAAMGTFRRGGTVFSAGTTDWAQVLGDARDRRVERITRNVLERLGRA